MMTNRLRRMLCAFVMLCAAGTAGAQLIPVTDFARHAEVNEVTLSPRGDYIAIAVPSTDDDETLLRIVNLDGSGKTQVLRYGNRNHVTDVVWSDDEQLVVSRGLMDPLRARPYSLGELVSSNISGGGQKILFAHMAAKLGTRGQRDDDGFASVVKVLDKEPGVVLVAYSCFICGEEPNAIVYKVDTRTGSRKEVERVDMPASFVFDSTGKARIAIGSDDNDDPKIIYRQTTSSAWAPLPAALAGYSLEQARFAEDGNTVFALISDKREPRQLYRLDLAKGTRQKVAGRDDVEVADLLYEGRDGQPFAVIYDAYQPSIQYLDPSSEWAKLHDKLLGAFPDDMVKFVDTSRDGTKILFTAWSDRNPGAYYLFDRTAGKVKLVQEVAPWIKPGRMASTRPIEFRTRDGQQVFGFYTAKDSKTRPLVVLPHGGPYGIYDRWGYDDDVQFLASRGYGVLQVNYRGSGGRGQSYITNGYRQWGGEIQDDIADGVQWAVGQKLASAGNICIFGASFGGYAALMNPIRNPGMYKCAVGYVGVYDLKVMFKAGDIRRSETGRRYLSRVLGDDQAVLEQNSPAQNVDKIGIPVFLAQGSIDQRVPMQQFNAMRKAFEKAGTPAETMVAEGEGHGFYLPDNRAALYAKIEAFLGKHLSGQAL